MPRPVVHLFNTLTRAVEPLVPLDPAGKRVSLYVCGPTIYNYGHIGNFRTYVAVDLLRRALKHFGYQVDHVMNFTDVDDKTIRGSREKNLPLKEFTAIIADDGTNIRSVDSKSESDGTAVVDFIVETVDVRHLNRLVQNLRRVPGVRDVQRVQKI